MINLEILTDFKLRKRKNLKKWITAIIYKEGKRKVGNINYIFCDDEYLLDINQKHLQHDTYTDIITFDYSEGMVVSADIFISIDRVKENAMIFNVSFEDEFLRVLSHGVLHLCGYNDGTEGEKAEMRTKENECIEIFKVMFNE